MGLARRSAHFGAPVTAAHRAAALHHPPGPFLGRTFFKPGCFPWCSGPFRRRTRLFGAPAIPTCWGSALGAVFALALGLVVRLCVLGSASVRRRPLGPPRPRALLNAGDRGGHARQVIRLVSGSRFGVARRSSPSFKQHERHGPAHASTCGTGSGVVTSCVYPTKMKSRSLRSKTLEGTRSVSYATSSSVGARVSLSDDGDSASFTDDGSYTVAITTPPPPPSPVLTQPRQPDSVFNRGHCVTSSAGIADWSCGDALFMLSTPSYTTLDRARNAHAHLRVGDGVTAAARGGQRFSGFGRPGAGPR